MLATKTGRTGYAGYLRRNRKQEETSPNAFSGDAGFSFGTVFFCCKFLWMNAPGHARPEEFQRLRRFTGGRWHHWHTKRCPNSVKTMVCGGNTILRFRFQLYFIRSHCLLRVVGMNKTEVVNCNSSFWFGFSPGLTFMYHDVSTFSIIC